jgi:hypothetical protein
MEPSLIVSFVAFFAMVLAWLAAPAANQTSVRRLEAVDASREPDIVPAPLTL